jgi:predicted flap endonuclease-1-like 5' DNA nuclease
MMDQTTLLIIGAAVLVLAVVLFLLARTGRKPHEGPITHETPDEPLPEPVAAPGLPTTELEPIPAPAEPAGPPDELTRMKGLGPKAAALLNGMGITRYDQIAGWTDADVTRIDAHMGNFKGRIARDRWVEQAGYLAKDDTRGFEEKFGKLG